MTVFVTLRNECAAFGIKIIFIDLYARSYDVALGVMRQGENAWVHRIKAQRYDVNNTEHILDKG